MNHQVRFLWLLTSRLLHLSEDIRSMFNPVVDQILELVGRQINDANKESKRWVVNVSRRFL